MIVAVLDANVVVSALLRPEGACGRVVTAGIARSDVRFALSAEIVDEYRRSLAYPKVRRALDLAVEEVEAWLQALTLLSIVAPAGRLVPGVSRDPDDDKYLAAAAAARAAYVVSGDRDLLDVGRYGGVRVVSPRQFLDVLDARRSR